MGRESCQKHGKMSLKAWHLVTSGSDFSFIWSGLKMASFANCVLSYMALAHLNLFGEFLDG